MTARRSMLLQILALLVAIGMSMVVWPFLPGAVPIHWNLAGRPDAWGPPALILWLNPVILAGIVGTSYGLARRARVATKDLFAVMALLAGFFVLEHGLLLGAVAQKIFPLRPLLALVFGLFLGLAPILARVEQNPWVGVRTPWTLGSKRVWRETHRATARLWFVGGLVGSALAMFGAPLSLVFLFLLFLAFYPIAISYTVWKRLGRP